MSTLSASAVVCLLLACVSAAAAETPGTVVDAWLASQGRSSTTSPVRARSPADLRLAGQQALGAGDFREAARLFGTAVRLADGAGRDAAGLAASLEGLAESAIWLERYPTAARAIARLLALRKAQDGSDSAAHARALGLRGHYHSNRAAYRDAAADLREAARVLDRLQPTAPETVEVLARYAEALWNVGDRKRALDVASQAVATAERGLPDGHPEIANALSKLAIIRHENGDIDAALAMRRRAKAIAEAALGVDHPELALQLNDLAASLIVRGDYAEARRLQERARIIYERRLGTASSYATTAVYNLGLLAWLIGDYQEAAALQRRAIAIWEKTAGYDHPYVAWPLTGLADTLVATGRFREARGVLERALSIRERALTPDHPRLARTLTTLAETLLRLGETRRAEALASRAQAVWETAEVPDGLADLLVVRAQIAMARGRPADARTALEHALQIRTGLLGPTHPEVAEVHATLGWVLAAMQHPATAIEASLRAERLGRDHLRLAVAYLPERQGLRYAATRPSGLDVAISLAASAPESTLDAVIRARSLVFDEMSWRQRVRVEASGGALAPLWQNVAATSNRLASLTVRGPDGLTPEQYVRLLDAVRREREAAEIALAESSAAFTGRVARQDAGVAEVRAALPPSTALVSFVRHRSLTPSGGPVAQATPGGRAAYTAYVLVGGAAPVAVSLGDAGAIDALVERWRAAVGRTGGASAGLPTAHDEVAVRRLGLLLRNRVWDPVAAHLAQARTAFIVPDGALNLVAFAALPAGRGAYLVDDGPTVHYLSAERDLVVASSPRLGTGLLAIGGPGYGVMAGPSPSPAPARRSSCGTLESVAFLPLPAARREAEDVAALWRDLASGPDVPQVLTGDRASESAFKHAGPGRRVLHLATHGFFLDEKCEAKRYGGRGIGRVNPASGSARRRILPDNPLLLSGLALAGANRRRAVKPTEEDGILTAEEVTALDLDGVEWAVLSACNTGIGEIKVGEGVFGLRRAFRVAGARTTIMSLWDVEDRAARAWMRPLYEGRLKDKLSTAEAVRHASLTVLRDRRAKGLNTHPFYWAGFVAAGDWR